jgi:hypothetical protein
MLKLRILFYSISINRKERNDFASLSSFAQGTQSLAFLAILPCVPCGKFR